MLSQCSLLTEQDDNRRWCDSIRSHTLFSQGTVFGSVSNVQKTALKPTFSYLRPRTWPKVIFWYAKQRRKLRTHFWWNCLKRLKRTDQILVAIRILLRITGFPGLFTIRIEGVNCFLLYSLFGTSFSGNPIQRLRASDTVRLTGLNVFIRLQ